MSEIDVLRRVELLARNVKMNARSVLSERTGQRQRGRELDVQAMLMKDLRELESALVELDMLRAGARTA
jgi:hypothetical protein